MGGKHPYFWVNIHILVEDTEFFVLGRHHIKYLEMMDPATTGLSVVGLLFLMNAKKLKKAPLDRP